jgi:Carboxypeptidase regulatory-like domain/TonB dependent receptor
MAIVSLPSVRVRAVLHVVVLLLPLTAVAQSTNATLDGTIRDGQGGVLPGATVTVTNESTGLLRSVTTGDRGSYRISELPPGRYTVRVEMPAFSAVERQGVTLALGGNLTLNLDLQLASVQESVTVSGQSPLLETSQKSLETNISPAEVDDLPVKGRQFVDLALLAPGVTVDTASANSATDSISFGGFNEQFKSLWLEGIDINDEVTGGGSGLSNASRHTFSQESVQEFQIVANQYSVEFGRSGSGVINILTKSGSNRTGGRGYYFLRDDAFDKPNAFATGKVPFRQQQFGGTLGGPIVRDRMHYFASYERQIYDDVVTVNVPAFVVPLMSDPRTEVPRPLRQHNLFGKLTATLSARHYLSFTGMYGNQDRKAQDLGGNIAGDGGFDEKAHDVYLAGAVTSVFTNAFTNQLRVAYSDAVKDRFPSGAPGPRIIFPSISFGQATNFPQTRQQLNYIVMNTTNYHLDGRGGTHDFKGGFEINISRGPRTINTAFNGEFLFTADRLPDPNVLSTYPARYRTATGSGALDRDVDMYAFFLEDNWRLGRGLTLSAGLRYDLQFLRGDLQGEPVPEDIPAEEFWARFVEGDLRGRNWMAYPNDFNNVGPRVGFAWDPHNTGRMVVRGGYGVFFDQIWTNDTGNVVQNYPSVFTRQLANDARVTNIPNTFFPNAPPASLLSATGSTAVQVPNAAAESPSTQQSSIGVQRQIGANASVSADYIHVLGLHFRRAYNANARRADRTFPLLPSGTVITVGDYGNRIHSDQVQLKFERQLANNFSLRTSYTYMKVFQFLETPVDKTNRDADWGPAANDTRHRMVISSVYRMPFDIQFGTIITAMSAPPYNVTTGVDSNGDRDINERPIENGTMIAPFSARGDNYFSTDLRISRAFRLGGQRRLEALFEMFNLTNTKNFGGYDGNMSSTFFGQPRFALPPFQGQLGLRLDF